MINARLFYADLICILTLTFYSCNVLSDTGGEQGKSICNVLHQYSAGRLSPVTNSVYNGELVVINPNGDTAAVTLRRMPGTRVFNLQNLTDSGSVEVKRYLTAADEYRSVGGYTYAVYASSSLGSIDDQLSIGISVEGQVLFMVSSTWGDGIVCKDFARHLVAEGLSLTEATALNVPPPPAPIAPSN